MMPKISLVVFFLMACSASAEDVIRETKQGRVRGRKLMVNNIRVEEFVGIPYAEPPVGNLRFRPPLPRSRWNGTLDATRPQPVCPQLQFNFTVKLPQFYSEDCLQLTVWTPASRRLERLPVLVYIHGGAYALGSAYSPDNNGTHLAARTGCIVVAMNYRLGVLGFLNADSPEAPGNMGMMDQQMALQWVQTYIEEYGGDASMVTLFGGSAGSHSVNIHILSPLSKGLFRRAIMVSGSVFAPSAFDTFDVTREKGNIVAKHVGCSVESQDIVANATEVVGCLRLRSVAELLEASSKVGFMGILTFQPTFHDRLLPKVPSAAMKRGFFNEVDVLAGVASDEAAFDLLMMKSKLLGDISEKINQTSFECSLHEFISSGPVTIFPEILKHYVEKVSPKDREGLRRMHIDYRSDRHHNCHMQYFAEDYSRRGNSVYRYIFGHKYTSSPVPEWAGVAHTHDVRHYFAAPLSASPTFSEEDLAVSNQFAEVMASFIRHGVPELPNGETWPKYTRDNPVSVFLAYKNVTMVHGFRAAECELWRKHF